MKIAMIGSGNIATFFGMKLKKAGYTFTQVVSATLAHAQILAGKLECDYTDNITQLSQDADVYFFAVKDDVLLEFANNVKLADKLVIHTAGSIQLNELKSISSSISCIWSLYSIQKDNLPSSTQIPLIINYTDKSVQKIVLQLAHTISDKIYELDDHQKSITHLAAVFANNFSNHLFTLTHQILEKENIPFEIMLPIIHNTVEKLAHTLPAQNQSGPAIRHDEKTIHKHLQLLADNPQLSQIYELMTKSIQTQG
jgi:predicted short-subunit dehydrogenase-like oxidoreductase (DUF2520 family)